MYKIKKTSNSRWQLKRSVLVWNVHYCGDMRLISNIIAYIFQIAKEFFWGRCIINKKSDCWFSYALIHLHMYICTYTFVHATRSLCIFALLKVCYPAIRRQQVITAMWVRKEPIKFKGWERQWTKIECIRLWLATAWEWVTPDRKKS